MESKILDTVMSTAKGLHEAGIMKKKTLREFEQLCKPAVIKEPKKPS